MITAHQIKLLEEDYALDVDVIGDPYEGGEKDLFDCWRLYGFLDDVEYFWGSTGRWVLSIGRTDDGRYYASPDYRFKIGTEGYICCWYR